MDTMTISIRPTTPEERAGWPKTVIVPLEKPFVDERGAILGSNAGGEGTSAGGRQRRVQTREQVVIGLDLELVFAPRQLLFGEAIEVQLQADEEVAEDGLAGFGDSQPPILCVVEGNA